MKIKRILFVLIATVAIIATLAINTFAYNDYGVSNYRLPNVNIFVHARSSDYTSVASARDYNFEAINSNVNPLTNYNASPGGDSSGSVRSQWQYLFIDDNSLFGNVDALFRFRTTTLNPTYNLSFTFGYLPFAVFGHYPLDHQRISVESALLNTRSTSQLNQFNVEYNDNWTDINSKIIAYYTVVVDDVPLCKSLTINSGQCYDIISEIVTQDDSLSFSDNSWMLCFLTGLVIQTDTLINGDESSYCQVDFYSDGFNFYKSYSSADGLYSYNDYLVYLGDDLSETAYLNGYNEGFDDGFEDWLEEKGIFSYFIESLDAFLDFPIFPLPEGGSISLGLLLGVIVGAMALVWLLKLIAGG